jgi:hypothetical protein
MEEGTTRIEYLIPRDFIIKEFKEKWNLELVEAENFQNIYHVFKNFFVDTSKYEANPKTRDYFNDVKKYYDLSDEINKASFELTRLNKLYVFQKRENNSK